MYRKYGDRLIQECNLMKIINTVTKHESVSHFINYTVMNLDKKVLQTLSYKQTLS